MSRSISRRLFAVQGVLLVAGGLATGAIGWIVLGLLRPIAQHLRAEGHDVEPLVQRCLDRPALLLVPAAVAVACGVALTRVERGRWALVLVGTVSVAAVVAVALTCFLMLIAPLYQVPLP